MKKKISSLVTVMLALFIAVALASCGNNSAPPATGGDSGSTGGDQTASAPAASGQAPDTIKIGIPTPLTGVISGFGMGTPFIQNLAVDAVNANGGIYIADYDKKIPIEILTPDSESDPTKAGEVAEQLATKDNVNMLIAQHTPDNTIPVAQVGEKYGIPTVSNGCPTDPLMAAGPYNWVFQSFWNTGDAMDVFIGMWKQLGYGPGTKVGLLLPNDADALAWKATIETKFQTEGFIAVDPGQYATGASEWTNIINTFKSEGVQIICGNDIAPDFQSFITQATQQGLKYDLITMGRAFLFPSDANALPESIINGLTNECWWSPALPFKSSIDGMTCKELADKYMAVDPNGDWYATNGDKYSPMEICVDALTRASSLDPAKIQAALAATDLDTISGHIQYDPATHTCDTPIAGGQWKWNPDRNRAEEYVVYPGTFPSSVQPDGQLVLPNQG